MIVYVCGISGIIEAFALNIPVMEPMSWTRFRLKIFSLLKAKIEEQILSTYYCPMYLVDQDGALLDRDDLNSTTECIVLPRGSHSDEYEVDFAAAKNANDPKLNWAGRKGTFDKYGDYCEEARVSLCNLNFVQIDKDIIKCQMCDCAQRFDHTFLPVMMQHGLANPSCPALEMWNGKTSTSPAMVSRWAKELVKQTISNLNTHNFMKALRRTIRGPELNEHHPKRRYICSICLTNTAEVLYLPCLHLATCIKCHKDKTNNTCQNCAQPITIATKIFN